MAKFFVFQNKLARVENFVTAYKGLNYDFKESESGKFGLVENVSCWRLKCQIYSIDNS